MVNSSRWPPKHYPFHISTILKDSNYSLTRFEDAEIEAFNEAIIIKEVKGKPAPYVKCIVRQKEIKLTPEEIVRQLFVRKLMQHYQYPVSRMAWKSAFSNYSDTASEQSNELQLPPQKLINNLSFSPLYRTRKNWWPAEKNILWTANHQSNLSVWELKR